MSQTDDPTLEHLKQAWESAGISFNSIPATTVLFERPGCTIFVDEEWGPPVPYRAVNRERSVNHGYRPTKGDRAAIEAIPEVQEWPEFKDLLLAINHPDGPYESVGCEEAFFPADRGEAKVQLGAYLSIICSDYPANTPDAHLSLAIEIARTLEDCLQWWGFVEIGIERLKHLSDVEEPWGMMLKLVNFGPGEAKAREAWSYSASLLEEMFYTLAGCESLSKA